MLKKGDLITWQNNNADHFINVLGIVLEVGVTAFSIGPDGFEQSSLGDVRIRWIREERTCREHRKNLVKASK